MIGIFAVLEANDFSVDALERTLSSGAVDLECRNGLGMTPLLAAAWHGRWEACERLLGLGALVNAQVIDEIGFNGGMTALMFAAERHCLKTCQVLEPYKPNLEMTNDYGENALFIAVSQNNLQICRFLLKCGADVNIQNDLGTSILEVALNNAEEHFERIGFSIIKQLICYGIEIRDDLDEGDLRVSLYELLQRCRKLDTHISGIKTPQALIDFLENTVSSLEGISGDWEMDVHRVLALKFGGLAYPWRCFEMKAGSDFCRHLGYFSDWLRCNPGVVGQATVSEEAILGFFKEYLLALSEDGLKKRGNLLTSRAYFREMLPPELSNMIFGFLPQGLVSAFHYDLAHSQALFFRNLAQSCGKEQVMNHPKYHQTLIWSRAPFVVEEFGISCANKTSAKRKQM